MPREVRFTVRMSREEHDMLEVIQERHDRDRGSMIRWLIRLAYSVGDVVNRASTVRQLCVNDASMMRQLAESGPVAGDETIDDSAGTEVALKKKREKEQKKKEKKPALASIEVSEEVIGYLNELTGGDMRPKAIGHRRIIQERLNAGATVEELKTVIRKKCAEWLGKEMQTNLKPSCLFRASNFDGYLDQLEPGKAQAYGKKNHVQRMTEAQGQGEWSWEGVE